LRTWQNPFVDLQLEIWHGCDVPLLGQLTFLLPESEVRRWVAGVGCQCRCVRIHSILECADVVVQLMAISD
jgi:hypothetical protein